MSLRRRLGAASAAGVALGLLAAGAAWAATAVVDQKDLRFSVKDLVVTAGDTVQFMNGDDTAHNITVRGAGLVANSGLQRPGEPFRVMLANPGVYSVTCGIHPRMKMTVTVR